jgi:hypothetical protein
MISATCAGTLTKRTWVKPDRLILGRVFGEPRAQLPGGMSVSLDRFGLKGTDDPRDAGRTLHDADVVIAACIVFLSRAFRSLP